MVALRQRTTSPESPIPPMVHPSRWPRQRLAFAVYACLSGLTVAQLIIIGRPWGAVALVGLVLVLRSPILAIIVTAVAFRLMYLGATQFDPIPVTQAGFARIIEGLSPYGHAYAESVPVGAPYVYGPLAAIWWLPGPVVELVAAIALFVLLARVRAYLTLAVVAGLPWLAYLTLAGNNDYSPALLLSGGLLLLRSRPVVGGILIALSTALKPYTAAWFLPALAIGGWPTLAAIVGASAVLWSPVLYWGVSGLMESMRAGASMRPTPWPQFALAGVIGAASAFLRSWRPALLAGSAVFVLVLFNFHFVHLSYLVTLLTVTGVALEVRRPSNVAGP